MHTSYADITNNEKGYRKRIAESVLKVSLIVAGLVVSPGVFVTVQQPHALAWDWKEDAPDLGGIGKPNQWEDIEEPVHSDFAAVPAGTGALLHQSMQPGSKSAGIQLPAEGTVESAAWVELKTLELQHMASLTVSPRKRTMDQCPPSSAGQFQQADSEFVSCMMPVEGPTDSTACVDAPLQLMATLTISPPRKFSLDQCPPSTAGQCMQPVSEDSSNVMSVEGAPDYMACVEQPLQHVESLTVGPGKSSLAQTRPMSAGRYEDAESFTGLETPRIDAVLCSEGQQVDYNADVGWAASTPHAPPSVAQEADVAEMKDPLATGQDLLTRPPSCGEAGPSQGVRCSFISNSHAG